MEAFIIRIFQAFNHKLRSVKYVMILRILFGSYHKIDKPRSFNYFVKLYCLTFNVVNACVFLVVFNNMFSSIILQILLVLEVLALSLFTLFMEEFYFIHFCSRIQTINRLLSMSQRSLEAPSLCVLYSLLVVKIIHTTFQTWSLSTTLMRVAAICFNNMVLSIYLNRAPSIVTFDLFRSTMKRIRVSLETKLNGADRTNEVKAEIITKHLLIYKHLLDNMRDNSKMLKIFMFYNIVTICLKNIILISQYFLNADITLLSVLIPIGTDLLENSQLIICNALAEMALIEFEKVRIVLGKQLLLCKNDCQFRLVIYDTLDYLECRPPIFSVLRMFSMGIDHIKGFIILCVTYVIVLLQTLN